jgi:hypothetical protein
MARGQLRASHEKGKAWRRYRNEGGSRHCGSKPVRHERAQRVGPWCRRGEGDVDGKVLLQPQIGLRDVRVLVGPSGGPRVTRDACHSRTDRKQDG